MTVLGYLAAALVWPFSLTFAAEYVAVESGTFVSVLANDGDKGPVRVAAFAMRATPVTNEEFLVFVKNHPEWQQGRVPETFADGSYLRAWENPTMPGNGLGVNRPVTNISWFAAQAFCENEGARLPSWYEWEYVAASDERRKDARRDPAWRERILSWYGRSSNVSLPAAGGLPNAFGIRDLHGLIWEWVDDFNALLVSADSRNQGDPDQLKFCGAGAISLQDRENYAVLMRIALLSSLNGADTTKNLGFRCARTPSTEK
ncbi:MAG TPA: formylglycine-generating enzyme family protein [Burkholderiaceae bacterium]|jgi:formylglycine-generating enzyme required for sulfatase activity|nr:formylglycine-generating enzyme family protein [Burkholderiaceae bacterium]